MAIKEEVLRKIEAVEKEILETPYDKSSQFHHGVLKAKLAKLKDTLENYKFGGGGGGVGYAIKHSGDASVVLVGLPSVGKSTLLNRVTNAESKVGNYDFTTLGVIPGMIEYKGVKIQILDLPGIVEGAATNKGFGKKVISVIRAADMVVIMTDAGRLGWFKIVEDELYKAGIRLNEKPVKIHIQHRERGAIQVIDPFRCLEKKTIIEVAKEMGYDNATIQLGERIENLDRLVDGMVGTRKYMPGIKVMTKIDINPSKSPFDKGDLGEDVVMVSAEKNIGIEEFKEKVWEKLGLIRVYLKRERGGDADRKEPLIMRGGQKLKDVLGRISSEMRKDVGRAYIWGSKARFPGQEVSLNFSVFDEMEVWFGR